MSLMKLSRCCANFGKLLSGSLPRGAYVVSVIVHSLLAVIVPLIFGCFTRMEKREKIDAVKTVEIISYSEIEEQGREAWYRHLRQTWKPRLVLHENSITCEDYTTAKQRLKFRNHPINAPPLNLQPPLPLAQRHVEVEDICDVFLVYDEDSCRELYHSQMSTRLALRHHLRRRLYEYCVVYNANAINLIMKRQLYCYDVMVYCAEVCNTSDVQNSAFERESPDYHRLMFDYMNNLSSDQPDEDELTQDYPEQLLKPLKTANKLPKKKAEQRERDDGIREPIAGTQKVVAEVLRKGENGMEASNASLSESSLPSPQMKLI